jgi:hypothetical protein
MLCPFCNKNIPGDKRTLKQNSALHLWLSQVEGHCWERGLTLEALFKEPADIPITREYLKDFFRKTADLMYHKDSTTQLTKKQLGEVQKVCEREFAKRLDCDIPFPSLETLIEFDKNN